MISDCIIPVYTQLAYYPIQQHLESGYLSLIYKNIFLIEELRKLNSFIERIEKPEYDCICIKMESPIFVSKIKKRIKLFPTIRYNGKLYNFDKCINSINIILTEENVQQYNINLKNRMNWRPNSENEIFLNFMIQLNSVEGKINIKSPDESFLSYFIPKNNIYIYTDDLELSNILSESSKIQIFGRFQYKLAN